MSENEAGDVCPKCGKGKLEDMGRYVSGDGWLECDNCGHIPVK